MFKRQVISNIGAATDRASSSMLGRYRDDYVRRGLSVRVHNPEAAI
jgi:hypothetical protein